MTLFEGYLVVFSVIYRSGTQRINGESVTDLTVIARIAIYAIIDDIVRTS